MFTGIISKTSKVTDVKLHKSGMSLGILNNLRSVKKGDSISINGVCSTVKKTGKNILFEYMPETLAVTNLKNFKKGEIVNIEQSMRLQDRLDGHLVLGHVDGVGKITHMTSEGNSQIFEIGIPDNKFMKFLVYKGSIGIEGISLTVAKVLKKSFIVKIIPYTLAHTNLQYKKTGDSVNIEFDILAKYIHANKK
jgi:riboflavin synthase